MNLTYNTKSFTALTKCRLSVTRIALELYLLERLKALEPAPFQASHDRVYREIDFAHHQYVKALARTFRDFLVFICAGEGRHADHWFGDVGEWSGIGERHVVYKDTLAYDPITTLRVASKLFARWGWGGKVGKKVGESQWTPCVSVGGLQWHRIAECGLSYGRISDSIFCDTVMTLQHNGNRLFNKPIMFRCEDDESVPVLYVLNTKFAKDLLDWPAYKAHFNHRTLAHLEIDGRIISLIQKAARVGLIKQHAKAWAEIEGTSFERKLPAVQWGTKTHYNFNEGSQDFDVVEMFKEAGLTPPAEKRRQVNGANILFHLGLKG